MRRLTLAQRLAGQPRWTEYFYDKWTTQPGSRVEFYVNAADVAAFPELSGYYMVELYMDPKGYIWGHAFREPEAA